MDLNQTFALNKDIVWRLVDKEAVILDVSRGEYFSLNDTGTEIFLTIANKKPLVSYLTTQQEIHKIGEKNLKADIVAFLRQLLDERIIKRG